MTKSSSTTKSRSARNTAAKKAPACEPAAGKSPADKSEEQNLIRSLRANKRLIETSDRNAKLPQGVTHILLHEKDEQPRLIEMRKSLL